MSAAVDLLDCEVDAVLAPRLLDQWRPDEPSIVDRAFGQYMRLRGRSRTAIVQAFRAALSDSRLDAQRHGFAAMRCCDWAAFRMAWLAVYREYEHEPKADPEGFFSARPEGCEQCAGVQ